VARRERLAQRRKNRGLTQEQLAEELGVDRTTVARWERGGNQPQPAMRMALSSVLEVSLQQLDLLLCETEASYRTGETGTGRLVEPGASNAIVMADTASLPQDPGNHASGAYSGRWSVVLAALATDARTDILLPRVGRRESNLIMADSIPAPFGQRFDQPPLDPCRLDQIDDEIARIAAAYLTEPLVPLVADMRWLRNGVFTMIQSRHHPAQTRQLHRYGAQVCGMLASASSDLGFYDAAQTHAHTALLYSDIAGDPSLRSWILATQSLIAFWDERPAQALDRVLAGHSVTTTAADLVRLASLEARARARLGDLEGTNRAIALARETMDTVHASRHESIFDFPAANALRCAGSAQLWLGEHGAAVSTLTQALGHFHAGPAPGSYAHVAVTRVDLALAHLGLGELDAAQETLRPVFSLSPTRRLSGIVRRSRDLHSALSTPRYLPSRSTGELIGQVEDFCTNVARHALTEPTG
jgi:transcriptional regulator with XRE-family HTH domain